MSVILTKRDSGLIDYNLLGQPTDGSFSDGLLSISSTDLIADAVDNINELLLDLAPSQPNTIDGTSLSSNRSLHTGKIPSGLNTVWYQDSISAGDTISYILEYDNLVLSSASPSDTFGSGDEGNLIAKHDEGGAGLNSVATLDIESNFDTSIKGPDVQDLSTWDTQGDGDPVNNAIVNFSNSKGNLEVTSCGWYNDFNSWQKMNAKLTISSLGEGYNSFRLTHSITSGDRDTDLYKLWYDDDSNVLSFSSNPTISENTLSSTKYLSGVRYYSTGDTFDISYTGSNVYKKCYHPTHVSRYRFDGESAESNVNPLITPAYNDSINVNTTVTINRTDYHDLDAILTAYLDHPWKSTVSAQSSSENRFVLTYGNVSTDKIEYFRDENYRLPIGDYDSDPGSLTGNWDSTSVLSNGNALVYNQGVRFPNIDFTSILPTGNPDYSSGFSGNQYYYRGFYDSESHSSVTFTINDISSLSSVGSGDLNIEIKLPSQTGWLDAGASYNSSTFTGVDGDGCQVIKSESTLSLTFGTFSTANSYGIIVVKITFRNTSVTDFTYMEVTNW